MNEVSPQQMQQDVSDILTTNFLAITLSLPQWSDRKGDSELAKEIARQKGAVDSAIGATKKIMAGADAEYKALTAAQTAVRTYLYGVSAPLSITGEGKAARGPRLVPTTIAMDVIKRIGELRKEFEARKAEFKAVYAQRVQEALKGQGSMANPDLYPDPTEIDGMFGVNYDIDAVKAPSDFDRTNLPAAVTGALGQRMLNRQKMALDGAADNVIDKCVGHLKRMEETLGKVRKAEQPKIFDTITTIATSLGAVLESLHELVPERTDVISLTDHMKRIGKVDPDSLRGSLPNCAKLLNMAEEAMVLLGIRESITDFAVIDLTPKPKAKKGKKAAAVVEAEGDDAAMQELMGDGYTPAEPSTPPPPEQTASVHGEITSFDDIEPETPQLDESNIPGEEEIDGLLTGLDDGEFDLGTNWLSND